MTERWLVINRSTHQSNFRRYTKSAMAQLCGFINIERRIFELRYSELPCFIVKKDAYIILTMPDMMVIIMPRVIYMLCKEISGDESTDEIFRKNRELNHLVNNMKAGSGRGSDLLVVEAALTFKVDQLLEKENILASNKENLSAQSLEKKMQNLILTTAEVMGVLEECKEHFNGSQSSTVHLHILLCDCKHMIKGLALQKLHLKQQSKRLDRKQVSIQSIITLLGVIGCYVGATTTVLGTAVGWFGIAAAVLLVVYFIMICMGRANV